MNIEGDSFSLGHPSGTEIVLLKGRRNDFDLGIEKESVQQMSLYPNPANSTIFFSEPVVNCEILTLSGQTVFKCNGLNSNYLIVNDLPNGIYIVNLDGVRFKVIKQS